MKEVAASTQKDLEKKLRVAQEQNRALTEEVDEAQTELASVSRQNKHQFQEIETKHTKLQQTLNDLRTDLENKESAFRTSQQKLLEREAEVGSLESEVLKLRAQGGDAEELTMIKRELSEQVTHIRKLEMTNREQTNELRRFREEYKAIGIIEEEKRTLQNKLIKLDEVERELGEAKIQRQLLEDERNAWVSYLQHSMTEGQAEFDSPEAMARALTEERMEHADLVNKLGTLQPEVLEKAARIDSLEVENHRLKADLKAAKATASSDSSAAVTTSSSSSDARAKARLERQKNLAVKEIDYLRAQLKTFESEDTATADVSALPSIDEQARARISTLEDLVSQYRSEVQSLQTELSAPLQTTVQHPPPSLTATKRPLPDSAAEPDPRLGELERKNNSLKHSLSALQKAHTSLAAELAAAKTQLSSLQSQSRTRILSLRQNPTRDHDAVKLSSLRALSAENAALHQQLAGRAATDTGAVVPVAYLDSARAAIEALEASVADKEKRLARMRAIWSRKSLEFRAAVASLLGWRVDFVAGAKFRLTSLFYPDPEDGGSDGDGGGGGGGGGNGDDERTWGTSLVFDGETGTMKIAGGSEGPFGREIRGLVRFWVEERGEVPGLLAAMTLEWLERRNAGADVGGV